MAAETTQELVRDPCEIIFEDGRRYATQRWITRCDDWRDTPLGIVNFGWVRIGEAFPTPDSVPTPFYKPPRETIRGTLRKWIARLLALTPSNS